MSADWADAVSLWADIVTSAGSVVGVGIAAWAVCVARRTSGEAIASAHALQNQQDRRQQLLAKAESIAAIDAALSELNMGVASMYRLNRRAHWRWKRLGEPVLVTPVSTLVRDHQATMNAMGTSLKAMKRDMWADAEKYSSDWTLWAVRGRDELSLARQCVHEMHENFGALEDQLDEIAAEREIDLA